jgi:5'-methylthioadenosine phosphorylase
VKVIGIISGIVTLHKKGVFSDLHKEFISTEFGKAEVFCSEDLVFIARHGTDPSFHILPHLINHQANLAAMKKLGATEVIGINSTGTLKRDLEPGTLVVPDDYIQLRSVPTAVIGKPLHIIPRLSEETRQRIIEAARDCNVPCVDGGIYWQTVGPRLETKAEIALISQFADIVGMTMASEATIAQELDIRYASLCSVDNFAHGIGDDDLTMHQIVVHARRNAEAIHRILTSYVKQRS